MAVPRVRVLQVIPSVGPLRGGPSAAVRQLASGLARAGIDSHVATTNDNGADILDVPVGVPQQQDGATYWHFERQARPYTFSWPLAAWLREQVASFDVVHIHALFSWAALPASHWAYWRGVPYVVRPLGTLNAWGMTERRPWLKAASFRLVESRIVKHAALMHYTSEQERSEAESLGIRTPAAVIPNALAVQPQVEKGAFRRRHDTLGDRPLVLFLSRLDAKKGVDLLLQAFAEVRASVPRAVLAMAGDRSSVYAQEMHRLAASIGVADAVVWTGFLSGLEKAEALADADVFVLPSHSENFGIAVAEAMAAGLPVIVSDQVAIAPDVREAGAGLVVPREVRGLARALVEVLDSPAARADMGRRGQALARERYSESAVTARLLSVYTGLVH